MMSEDGLSTLDVPIHIAQDHIPKLLIFTLIVNMVDIIWLFVMWGIWTKKLKHNEAWNTFSTLHYFVLLLALLNVAVKVKIL